MSSSSESALLINEDTSNRYPVADPALRKSCDRCYSQKLKCSKTDVSADCCVRCSRAGVPCYYSTRLARQTPKRPGALDHGVAQRTPKRSRQELLLSPGLEEHAQFDPMSLVQFDTDSAGFAGSTFLGEFRTEYTWPPEEWMAAEASAVSVAFLNEAPVALLPQLETMSQEPSTTESDADKQQNLLGPDQSDENNDRSHRLSMTKQARSSIRLRDNREPKIVHSGSSDKQLSLCHRKTTSGHESFSTRSNSNIISQGAHLSEDLHSLSRRLEAYHQRMSVTESPEDLQNYPIGETLEGSKALLSNLREEILQSSNPYLRHTSYDQPTFSSRTTHSFIGLQCYVLCVKVLTRLCQNLLAHPHMLAESEAQAKRQERTVLASRRTAIVMQTAKERPNDLIEEALCLPLHPGLLLGELHIRLDPLGHTLNCICGALRVGFKLLRGIEASLGIPKALGVSYESPPKNAEAPTVLPEDCAPTELQSDSPSPPSSHLPRRLDGRHRYPDGRTQGNSETSMQERLITVLWEEATVLNRSSGVHERVTLVLQRCSKQIYALTQRHMLSAHTM